MIRIGREIQCLPYAEFFSFLRVGGVLTPFIPLVMLNHNCLTPHMSLIVIIFCPSPPSSLTAIRWTISIEIWAGGTSPLDFH